MEMTSTSTSTSANTTPNRPPHPLGQPSDVLALDVDVQLCHLANPAVAVARLLASEARALCNVTGDESRLNVEIALPSSQPAVRATAEAWARWALHNAGVRGEVSRTAPAD